MVKFALISLYRMVSFFPFFLLCFSITIISVIFNFSFVYSFTNIFLAESQSKEIRSTENSRGLDNMELEIIKTEMRASNEIENNEIEMERGIESAHEMRASSEISNYENEMDENNMSLYRNDQESVDRDMLPFEYQFPQSSREESVSENEGAQSIITTNNNNIKKNSRTMV